MNITKSTKAIVSAVAVCAVIALANISIVNASTNDGFFDERRAGQEQRHKGNKHKMKRMIKALSLSDQQQAQIKTIKSEAREQGQALKATMTKFRAAKQALIHAKSFDENAFKALQNEYQATFAQLALIRTKAKHSVFNVLTTEQQNKWLKIIESKKGKGNRKARNG